MVKYMAKLLKRTAPLKGKTAELFLKELVKTNRRKNPTEKEIEIAKAVKNFKISVR